MKGQASPGLLLVLGVASLCGAAALAWFSSVETLQLTRTEDGISVVRQSRLFALVTISETRLDHVTGATTLTTLPDVSRARPWTDLLFDTPTGQVDLWVTQDAFVRQYPEIKAFFDDPMHAQATFSNLFDWRETMRFGFAQLAVAFLALVGGGILYMAGGSLFGPDTSIGPV